MSLDVCAIVLAAGLGTRLRPLTTLVPKALVPVGNVPLLERSLRRLADAGLTGPDHIAVNAHHHTAQIEAHVNGRARLSIEDPEPLGSAGAVGKLSNWIDGRPVLVLNADAYVGAAQGDLLALLDGWDGKTVRMVGHHHDDGHPPFNGLAFAGASLLPGPEAAALPAEFGHLVGAVWRPAQRAGRLEVVPLDGRYIDCGTPADYLAANLHAAGDANLIDPTATVPGSAHRSVIGAGATVHGRVTRCVLWPGAEVGPDESLSDLIRTHTGLTVPAA